MDAEVRIHHRVHWGGVGQAMPHLAQPSRDLSPGRLGLPVLCLMCSTGVNTMAHRVALKVMLICALVLTAVAVLAVSPPPIPRLDRTRSSQFHRLLGGVRGMTPVD